MLNMKFKKKNTKCIELFYLILSVLSSATFFWHLIQVIQGQNLKKPWSSWRVFLR